MGPYFLNDWAIGPDLKRPWDWNGSQEAWDSLTPPEQARAVIAHDFRVPLPEVALYDILLASYTNQSYSGDAFLVLRRRLTGALFLVEASHCSCFGLEGQWHPEPTDVDALERHLAYHYRVPEYQTALELLLVALKAEGD